MQLRDALMFEKKFAKILVIFALTVFVIFLFDFLKVAYAEPQFLLRPIYVENFDSSLGMFKTRSLSNSSSNVVLVPSSSPQGGKAVLIFSNGSSPFPTYIYINFSYKSTLSLSFFANIVSQLDLQRNFVFLNFSHGSSSLILFRNSTGYISANSSNLNRPISSSFRMENGAWYRINLTYLINDSSLILIMGNTSSSYNVFKIPFNLNYYGTPITILSVGVLSTVQNSRGSLLVDNFIFSASPIINVSSPIAIPGEKIRIKGDYFKENDFVNVSLLLNNERTLLVYPVQTSSNGSFLFTVSLPLEIESGLYRIIASQKSINGEVIFHLGVIKPKIILNKTVPFSFYGYNFKPFSNISLSLFSVAPKIKILDLGHFISDANGSVFFKNITFPAYLKAGNFSLSISSGGTLDYCCYNFVKDFQITILPAPLNVLVKVQKGEYLRSQQVVIYAFIKYVNGTSISPSSRVYIEVLGPQIPVVVKSQMNYLSAIGGWVYSFKLPLSSPLGLNYATVTADDSYGNFGSNRTTFLVKPGLIQVSFSNLSSSYERPSLVKAYFSLSYPDGSSVSNGTYTMLISNSVYTKKFGLVYLSNYSYWLGAFMLSPSDPLGNWNVSLVGQDFQGNMLSETFSFSVLPSKLDIILFPINSSYYRTQEVSVSAIVRYPFTGEPLFQGTGIVFLRGINSSQSFNLIYNSSLWTCSFKIPIDAKVGSYNLTVFVTDIYSNNGSITKSIEIKKAPLKIYANLSKRSIQVGFDSVKIVIKAQYPDGTLFSDKDGNLSVVVIVGKSTKELQTYYSDGNWVSYLQTSLFDSGGEYLISIKAEDNFDNAGSYVVSMEASQLFAALSLGLIVVSFAVITAIFWRYTSSRKKPSAREAEFILFY